MMSHPPQLQCLVLGLASRCVQIVPPVKSHRHQEIEFNFIERGKVRYLFGGKSVVLCEGQLAVFWAAIPHRVIEADKETTMHWLTVPLGQVLSWHLPGALAQRLMDGQFILGQEQACEHYDERVFRRWQADLAEKQTALQDVILLESEACLRRLAYSEQEGTIASIPGVMEGAWRRAEQAAAFIAEHYTRPISVRDIAHELGLHSQSVMRLFQQTFGMSVVAYITQFRLAQAQRMLATTNLSVLAISGVAGFGSASRFYDAFTRAFGRSPRAYRLSLSANE